MDFLVVLRVALKVLSEKLVILFSLSLSAFLAGWVMYDPNWQRVATLGIFSVFALLVGRKVIPNGQDQQTPVRIESAD